MSEFIFIAISLILVAACGVFVAAEFSLITVNRTAIERLANKGDKRSKSVLAGLKTLSTQLSGAQVGITITTLSIGFLAEPAITSLIEPILSSIGLSPKLAISLSILISIAIASAVTMIFGELIPKKYSLARPIETAKYVVAPQRVFSSVMKHPIKVLNGSANAIVRKLGVEPQEELASARSADELSSLVKRSAEQGTLAKETAQILERTLDFDELTALDVMTPRVKTHALQSNCTVQNVIDLTIKTGHSRFPVYGNNIDDIIGVIHLKNVIGTPKKLRKTTTIEKLMRKPVFAPSSIQLDDLLEILRKGGMQMAIVIDEFGGTDGIVTMEDIVEELVGEVQDEHDKSKRSVRKRHGGGWLIPGLMRPDEVGDETGIYLPEWGVETIGGQIAHVLERIPRLNDSITLKAVDRSGHNIDIKLTVIEIDKKRIDRIHLQPITPAKGHK